MHDELSRSTGKTAPDGAPTLAYTGPSREAPVGADLDGATLAHTPAPDEYSNTSCLPPGPGSPSSFSLPMVPGYTVLEELGRGGMGIVYHAVQRHLHRPVALKMVLAGEFACAETRLRFLTEAETIARLHHPGIVQVHEFGSHQGNLYFAMEYVSGGNLEKKLRDGLLAPHQAAELIKQLAEAVHVAHTNGVVHRDLKPANVLLTEDGQPKVADFGLAKSAGGSDLTATGAILGTPSYMAPEQAGGAEGAGPLVDVYSLGAILYECLTGRPPFKAATPLDTLIQVCEQEPVSVRRLTPTVPLDLETICHKCLQKEPAKRLASAKELADECQRFLAGEPIRTRPIGRTEKVWRWCRRNPAVATLSFSGAAVLLLSAVIAWVLAAWALDEKKSASAQADAALNNAARADAKAEEATTERIRADKEADQARRERNTARRAVDRLSIHTGLQLADDGDLFGAILWLASPLVKAEASEASEQTAAMKLRLANYLALSKRATLCLVTEFKNSHVQHAIQGDGRGIALRDGPQGKIIDWRPNHARQLDRLFSQMTECAVSQDGRRAIVRLPNREYQMVDLERQKRLALGLRGAFDPMASLSISANGRIAAVSEGKGLASVNRGDEPQPWRLIDLENGKALEWQVYGNLIRRDEPQFSPDGRRCLSLTRDGKSWEVLDVSQLGSTGPKRIGGPISTGGVFRTSKPVFSPDSTAVFVPLGIHGEVLNTETGRRILVIDRADSCVCFSPDGQRLASVVHKTVFEVWDIAKGHRTLRKDTAHRDAIADLTFSPDGRWIATASADATVRVWSASTGESRLDPIHHPDAVQNVRFSADGRYLLAGHNSGYIWCVWDLASGCVSGAPEMTNRKAASRVQIPRTPAGQLLFHERGIKSNQDPQTTTEALVGMDGKHQWAWTLPHKPTRGLSSIYIPDQSGTRILIARAINRRVETLVRPWNRETGQPIGPEVSIKGVLDYRSHLGFDPEGLRYVVCGGDAYVYGVCQVYDAATGRLQCPPLQHKHLVNHAAFLGNETLATASGQTNEGQVHLWALRSGQPIGRPVSLPRAVSHVAFSPDGRYLVASCGDSCAHVFAVASDRIGKKHAVLRHENDVSMARFDPSGRRIVTASSDRTARVWDAATGRAITPALLHKTPVLAVEFSEDGAVVITASEDTPLRLWCAESGQAISPDWPAPAPKGAAYSKRGDWVAILDNKDQVLSWQIPVGRPAADYLQLAEVCGGRRLDQHGTLTSIPPPEHLLQWKKVYAQYPGDFRVSPALARRWREEEISQCMKEGNAEGALLHRKWFMAEYLLEGVNSGLPKN